MTIMTLLRTASSWGRIFKVHAAPRGLAMDVEHYEDRSPTHGYTATREAAMTAFAKSWRRE
jgi:hypothetical protein